MFPLDTKLMFCHVRFALMRWNVRSWGEVKFSLVAGVGATSTTTERHVWFCWTEQELPQEGGTQRHDSTRQSCGSCFCSKTCSTDQVRTEGSLWVQRWLSSPTAQRDQDRTGHRLATLTVTFLRPEVDYNAWKIDVSATTKSSHTFKLIQSVSENSIVSRLIHYLPI